MLNKMYLVWEKQDKKHCTIKWVEHIQYVQIKTGI